MAKRKTARQKRAKRRAAYYRREFYKTLAAIAGIQELTDLKPPKITVPKKITKASLSRVRRAYTEYKKKAKKKGYLLPTKKELTQNIMSDPTQSYKYQRSAPFDPGADYLDSVMEALSEVLPARASHQSQDDYEKMLNAMYYPALDRLKGTIKYAADKVGVYELSQKLASSVYLERVMLIPAYYIWDAVPFMEGELTGLMTAAMESALDDYL